MRKNLIVTTVAILLLLGSASNAALASQARARSSIGDTPLVAAVKSGDVDSVRQLLASGADANALARDTATALIWAAVRDDLAAAQLLLEAGADPNIASRNNIVPLYEAITRGNAEMVDVLLQAGADVNARVYEGGDTPLMNAARVGDLEIAQKLIGSGAEVLPTQDNWGLDAMMFAATGGHADIVRLLAENGANPNTVSTFFDHTDVEFQSGMPSWNRTSGGLTALHFAARMGNVEAGRELIAAGSALDIEDEFFGYTPLQMAVTNQQAEFVSLLIEAGADLNDGSLYVAVDALSYADRLGAVTNKRNGFETLKQLLEGGADPSAPYTKQVARHRGYQAGAAPGATPLYIATTGIRPDAVKLLLDFGADASTTTSAGGTPLLAIVGFRPGPRGTFGGPQSFSNERARIEIVKSLIEAGANVHSEDSGTGNSVIHFAAGNGMRTVYDALIAYGASVSAQNDEGLTPADLLNGIESASRDE